MSPPVYGTSSSSATRCLRVHRNWGHVQGDRQLKEQNRRTNRAKPRTHGLPFRVPKTQWQDEPSWIRTTDTLSDWQEMTFSSLVASSPQGAIWPWS